MLFEDYDRAQVALGHGLKLPALGSSGGDLDKRVMATAPVGYVGGAARDAEDELCMDAMIAEETEAVAGADDTADGQAMAWQEQPTRMRASRAPAAVPAADSAPVMAARAAVRFLRPQKQDGQE